MASAVRAEEEPISRKAPYIAGDAEVEIQLDHTLRSDEPGNRVTQAELTAELDFALWLTGALSVQADLAFDSVTDAEPGEDRYFDDNGLYVEQLYVRYATDRVSLAAGKIAPAFGVAHDKAAGIYGSDFASDYEIDERIGVTGSLMFDTPASGRLTITGSTFFADTTFLSSSAFTERPRLRRRDGGVSNTGDFSSYALAVTGERFTEDLDLRFRGSASFQAAGRTENHDEIGLAFALDGTIAITEDIDYEWLAEIAHLQHYQGGDDDLLFLTAGGELKVRNWRFAPVLTLRKMTRVSQTDVLATLSAGYEFENNIGISSAYRFMREEGMASHTIGLKVRYAYEF